MVEYSCYIARKHRRNNGFSKHIVSLKSVYRKIVILGSKHCGKRTLTTRYFYKSFESDGPTDYFQYMYKHQNLILDIVNMADANHYLDEFREHVETADFIILAYEINNVASAQVALDLYTQLRSIREDKMPLVVVGTKLDMQKVNSPPSKLQETEKIHHIISKIKGAKHVLSSSKCNIGVHEAFEYGLNDIIKTIHTLSMSDYMLKQKTDMCNVEKTTSNRKKFCFGFRFKQLKRRAVTV